MAGFRRARRRGIELSLGGAESSLLADLVGQLHALLEPPPVSDPLEALVGLRGQAPPPPDDPALARLLPDAYRDDPAAAADYRRRTEDDLREGKRDAARRVLDSLRPLDPPRSGGTRVQLDRDAAEAWLATLNDLRLVLGARLGLERDEDTDALLELPPGDPRAPLADLYQYLTWLQGTLVDVLAGS